MNGCVFEWFFRKARCNRVVGSIKVSSLESDGTSNARPVLKKRRCRKLLRYEQESVEYHNFGLHEDQVVIGNDMKSFVRLSTFRVRFIDEIIEQVQKYLPDAKITRSFEVLDQRKVKK